MSEKDIKTKPAPAPKTPNVKGTSKIAVKSKEAVSNTVKDAKAVIKDTLVKKVAESKLGTDNQQSQPQKADTEAAESVENAAYTTADAAYHKGKTYTQNKIREHRENKAKADNEPELQSEHPETSNEPKQADNQPKTRESQEPKADTKGEQKKPDVKTKEQYLKNQKSDTANGVKTKESYIDGHAQSKSRIKGVKGKENISAENAGTPAPQNARKEYVKNKLKTKAEYEKAQADNVKADTEIKHGNTPKEKAVQTKGADLTPEQSKGQPNIKTKENYMQSLRTERAELVKSPYNNPKSKQTSASVKRGTVNSKKALKTRDNVVGKSKSVIKSGNAHTAKTTRNTVKTANKAAKTQKEVTKRAAKQAAIKAKQAAVKAAQAAKAAAVKTAKAVAAIGKAVAAAVTKAAAAFFAAFGWIGVIIVLIILIVIIIVAAIAGSPFGIFISDEAADQNSIPVSSIIAECNVELSQKLTDIEDNTTHNRIVMEGGQADWNLVLSLFSVKVAGTGDDTAQDVVIIDDAKKQKLKDVFWDMHTITSRTETVTSGETTETVLYITITAKTKDEMISQYGFNAKQKEALETLLENSDGYMGTMQSLTISDATAQEVIDKLPDSLSESRKSVVKKACSLVGKVNYFWGGKSSAIGWDSEWGKMKLVTAEGSRSSGCMRPFGLDCSGFVTWSFINSGFSASAIGHGTSTQVSKGTRISLSSAQPGDLAFYNDTSHVGIVGGKDASGNVLVIHCSSGANNVVITTGGFGFAVRPNCY